MKRLTLILCLLLAPAASAAERTQHYYTLNVAPMSASSAPTFLTAMPDGKVVNRAYKSGLKNQMWTEVYPEWPYPPKTTADAKGAWQCLSFCPYDTRRPVTERKFVNRANGRCLTMVGPRAAIRACDVARTQLFEWAFDKREYRSEISRAYTFLGSAVTGSYSCLTAAGATGNEAGSELYANRCNSLHRQKVRFLRVASATCDAPVTVVCGTKRS